MTASSQSTASGQTAVKAIDGIPAGYPGDSSKEWASAGGKTGTWLNLTWSSAQTLSAVRLYDRPNTSDNITGGTLTFSDGTVVTVPALDTAGAATTVTFTAAQHHQPALHGDRRSAPHTANIGLAEIEALGYLTSAPARRRLEARRIRDQADHRERHRARRAGTGRNTRGGACGPRCRT